MSNYRTVDNNRITIFTVGYGFFMHDRVTKLSQMFNSRSVYDINLFNFDLNLI